MPRVKRKFRDDEIVTCIESFATGALPGTPVFAFGTRLRGDHPAVRAAPQFWVPDGTPADEIASLRTKIYMDAEAQVPPPPQPELDRTRVEQRIPDEDALVDVYNGARVHKKSQTAQDAPDRYVPVVPPGLARKDALLARATMSEIGEDGKPSRTIYAGQWVRHDDPFVTLHPHNFELPSPRA